MAQPKYAARFENFFLHLRLNRADFADMAAFTLGALQANPAYKALADALEAELNAYRAIHAGQLSGEGQGATLTLAQALTDLKAYVKKVERKFIIPSFDAGSPDAKALLPNGRSGLTGRNQSEIEDAVTAFLDAMEARPGAFPKALLLEGRNPDPKAASVLGNLKKALGTADKAKKASGDRKIDLHDGRLATCVLLFKTYATLLLECFDNPGKAAPFFDLRKAGRTSASPKTPNPPKTV